MKPFITVIEDVKHPKGTKRTVFECEICGQRYFMLSKAHKHVLMAHNIKGDKTYDKIKTYQEVL